MDKIFDEIVRLAICAHTQDIPIHVRDEACKYLYTAHSLYKEGLTDMAIMNIWWAWEMLDMDKDEFYEFKEKVDKIQKKT